MATNVTRCQHPTRVRNIFFSCNRGKTFREIKKNTKLRTMFCLAGLEERKKKSTSVPAAVRLCNLV